MKLAWNRLGNLTLYNGVSLIPFLRIFFDESEIEGVVFQIASETSLTLNKSLKYTSLLAVSPKSHYYIPIKRCSCLKGKKKNLLKHPNCVLGLQQYSHPKNSNPNKLNFVVESVSWLFCWTWSDFNLTPLSNAFGRVCSNHTSIVPFFFVRFHL